MYILRVEETTLFFVGLTVSQVIFMSGIVLLFLQSYIVGGPIALLGAGASYVLFRFYEKRKKERKKKKGDVSDYCGYGDCCIDVPFPKKLDCDCSPDCTPDCSP